MLVVFIVAIVLLRFFYLQNHREKFCFHKEFWYLFSIVYMWLLFEILTMTELNSSSGMNLVPFSEILRYDFGSKIRRFFAADHSGLDPGPRHPATGVFKIRRMP